MLLWAARRVPQTLLALLGVSVVTFALLMASGDPMFTLLTETKGYTAADISRIRHQMGFDRPLYVQYGDYLWRVLHGDFGLSMHQGVPAMALVLERMPATVQLASSAMVISVAVSVPVGIVAAMRRNSVYDVTATLGALLGQSMPIFWLGILLIQIFGVTLRWFPVSGRGDLWHLAMPAVALAAFSTAQTARLVRSSMLEVLNENYIAVARGKGVREFTVIVKHALRNALLPVATLLGVQFGSLLTGSIVTETVFAWPGVGRLIIQSIANKDFPIVLAGVTVFSLVFVVINVCMDILYVVLDPRIAYT
ncbi:MAG TPA: ABC transporter permease [Gaiellales bacterium]|nr:ABC transporter permease [Gaiellales bacterium]